MPEPGHKQRSQTPDSPLEQQHPTASSAATSADQLEALVQRWQALAQQGQPVSVELLCRDCPELLEPLRQRLGQLPPPHLVNASTHPSAVGDPLISTGIGGSHPAAGSARDTDWQRRESLPEQFGRYRILKRLGRGSMGAVYLAHDTQLDRQVALKVPHLSPADGPELLARFYREARAAATLSHPGICPIYDVGQIGGVHYLAMAFLEGRPLTELIDPRQPLPQRQAAEIVRQLALALKEAHARGVVHRDLKPSNIMVSLTGQPVVMDFGLALRLSPGLSRLTQSGALLGTPAYMAPEQVEGHLEAIGPACDVYALGAILYELLTGRVPFPGSVAAVLHQILTREPEPPSTLRPGLDRTLEAICGKAMARSPADRYASMEELAAALSDYLRSDPQLFPERVGDKSRVPSPSISAPRSPSATPAPPRRRRKWGPLAAVAVALLSLGAMVLGVVFYLSTSQGRIRIEVDDPRAEVVVDGEQIRVEKLGEPITLWPGKHGLVVKRGDVVVETRNFTVVRGDNPVLKITLRELPSATPANEAMLHVLVVTPDSNGGFVPVPEAKVTVKRAGEGVLLQGTTDATGNFSGRLKSDNYEVSVFKVGYLPGRGEAHLTQGDSPPVRIVLSRVKAVARFHPLFDGRTLNGWVVDSGDPQAWSVEDKELVAAGSQRMEDRGWLLTQKDYSDFVLRLEFRLSKGGNSGVTLRARPGDNKFPEIQILDDTNPGYAKMPGTMLTGSLWRLAIDQQATLKSVGEWNALEIEVKGRFLRITVNGRETLRTDLDRFADRAEECPGLRRRAGRIGLQNWDSRVSFRNIQIQELTGSLP